jgi:hypothetical protein
MSRRLDPFTRAYIETALWSTNDESDERGGEPLDQNYDASDIAPETMDKIAADCAYFQAENAEALETYGDDAKAGHYFWLARNGHGAGYTDDDYKVAPDLSAAMKHLQKAAKAYGEVYLYVGDDDLIHGPPPGAYGVREARRPMARAPRLHAAALQAFSTETGAAVRPGSTVIDFRGDKWKLIRATRANSPGYEGKVLVKRGRWEQEFYAGVFNLEVR